MRDFVNIFYKLLFFKSLLVGSVKAYSIQSLHRSIHTLTFCAVALGDRMEIKMKKQEIVSVLRELHKITGFRISLHGKDYTEIAAYPEHIYGFCREIHTSEEQHSLCADCDRAACRLALEKRGTHIYKCRYGLTEAVSPLYNFGTHTGYLMMGQVLDADSYRENLISVLTSMGRVDAEDAVGEIPTVNPSMISSYVRIMTICAEYLTLSNAMPGEKPTINQMAKKYINDNLKEKFGIREICDEVGCSKSTLITSFKREFGTTVNAYITDARLAAAKKLLDSGEKSIGEIAVDTGFSDQSYFSKVFSSKFGFPPSEYRKSKEKAGES